MQQLKNEIASNFLMLADVCFEIFLNYEVSM